jgi:Cu/Ag efflux protein CusF
MKKAFHVRLIVLTALIVCLLLSTTYAQQSGKKDHTFRGKVEKVDTQAKKLTVNGEKVDGWMAAMTMAYSVDNADALKSIKVGDQITAKVYDGDLVLHDVKVVPADKASSQPPAKK